MSSRKYIVGVLVVALVIWGPIDESWPAWLAIRIGYLVAIPLAAWFLLGWLYRVWRPNVLSLEGALAGATGKVLLGMLIVFLAGAFAAKSTLHLLAELQISLFGKEADAHVVHVETIERDDGERSWEIDLINYTFTIPEGYVFSGINEANVSETERLIGSPDANGEYHRGTVQYLPGNPKIHRLKGWGYDGYGPPGGIGDFAVRGLIHLCIIGFACLYAYNLLTRSQQQ
jgi:hypothetical protein